MATTVVIPVGDAIAADDDDAVDAVVSPSSTKDKDAYIGASVAFEGACVDAFTDGAAAANVVLLRCCHCRSICAAATALPPLRCALPPRFTLLPPPLTLPCCRRRRDVALPPPPKHPRCCHRTATVALCAAAALRAAATGAAPLPSYRQRCAGQQAHVVPLQITTLLRGRILAAGYCAEREERPGGRDRRPCVGEGARSEGAVSPDRHQANDDTFAGTGLTLASLSLMSSIIASIRACWVNSYEPSHSFLMLTPM